MKLMSVDIKNRSFSQFLLRFFGNFCQKNQILKNNVLNEFDFLRDLKRNYL